MTGKKKEIRLTMVLVLTLLLFWGADRQKLVYAEGIQEEETIEGENICLETEEPEEESEEQKKEDEELSGDLELSAKAFADYPEFVSKLRLYLSAGLTVKNALFRMSSDYFGQQAKGKEHYLYKEIKLACHQLQNGMSEEQVYQDFGRRCGQMRYRRLSFLLSVHLKQGNQQLLMLLSQEADSAQEDRMSMARKAGEEAGTKLLLPMMLMMVVAMILVLLPAYINFGSI